MGSHYAYVYRKEAALQIIETTVEDVHSVIELVTHISQTDILPHFNEEGRETFSAKVFLM